MRFRFDQLTNPKRRDHSIPSAARLMPMAVLAGLLAIPLGAAADDEIALSSTSIAVCSNTGIGFCMGNVGCQYTIQSYTVTCWSDGTETSEPDTPYSSCILPAVGNPYCASSPSGDSIENTACEAYGFDTEYISPCEDPCDEIEEEIDEAYDAVTDIANQIDAVLDQAELEACASDEQAALEAEYEALQDALAAALQALADLNSENWASCQDAVDMIDKGTQMSNESAARASEVFCDICDFLEDEADSLVDELDEIATEAVQLVVLASDTSCEDGRAELQALYEELTSQLTDAIADLVAVAEQAADEGCAITDPTNVIDMVTDFLTQMDDKTEELFAECVAEEEDEEEEEEEPPEELGCDEAEKAVVIAISEVDDANDSLSSACDTPDWADAEAAYDSAMSTAEAALAAFTAADDGNCANAANTSAYEGSIEDAECEHITIVVGCLSPGSPPPGC